MPSTSKKQQRYMGMQLAQQRKTGRNETGMSEKQLGEFAGSVAKHGSLEDIRWHEEAAGLDTVLGDADAFVHPVHKGYGKGGEKGDLESKGAICWGALDPPKIDDKESFASNGQSVNRDAGQGVHYGAPVDYFGPDTDYRAEEIDMAQYGRDYEPIPLRDYYKSEDKQFERGFRLREQDEYDMTQTPGAVTDEQPQAEAYGAVNYQGAGPDKSDGVKAGECDHRSFESQRMFARTNKDKSAEYAVDVSGLDTHEGKDIK